MIDCQVARRAALEQLAPNGVIRVALNMGNAATVSMANAHLSGPAPDLAKQLAAWTGLPIEFLRYRSAGEVIEAARSGNVWDVAFLAIDPARAAMFHFTAPYLAIEAAAVVWSYSQLSAAAEIDTPGLLIASSKGAAYDLILQRTLRHATRVPFDNPAESIAGFERERLDILVAVRQILDRVILGRDDMRILPGSVATIAHAVAIPLDRTRAAGLLDEFIRDNKGRP